MTRLVSALPGLLLSLTLSCSAGGADPASGQGGPPSTAPASSAQAALDRLDDRSPVPLIPMMALHMKADMKDHLLVVEEITLALAAGDFEAVDESASRIAFTEDLANRCDHMGSGAPGFPELGIEFHRKASGIRVAAQARDRDGVLRALGETIQVCTGCHARFRQEVVDSAAWEQRTGSSAPHGH